MAKRKTKRSAGLVIGRMFLVVIRTNLDELPLALCMDRKVALATARFCTEKEREKAAAVMGVDLAGAVCTAIITFINGRPKDLEIIRDWDGETKEAA